MNTTPPTECKAWAQLAHHAESWRTVHLADLFGNDPARAQKFSVAAAGLRYDFSRQRAGAMTLRLLAHLAEQRGLPEWRSALLKGEVVNDTENRPAWHTALRAGAFAPPEVSEARISTSNSSAKLKIKTVSRAKTSMAEISSRLRNSADRSFHTTAVIARRNPWAVLRGVSMGRGVGVVIGRSA